jgi:NAD(P)H-dependent FMN reductase
LGSSENTRKLLKVQYGLSGVFSFPGVAKFPGHAISFRHSCFRPLGTPARDPCSLTIWLCFAVQRGFSAVDSTAVASELGSSENTRKLLKVQYGLSGVFSFPGLAKFPGHAIRFVILAFGPLAPALTRVL